jgi:hypothetical protein
MNLRAAAIFAAAVFFAAHAPAEPPAGPGTASRPSLGVLFDRALSRAAAKLESPACRFVLQDFRDASGRTLAENLADAGLSAPEFLTRIEYRDGRNESPCRRRHVDAFTTVGGSTVWTCPGGSLRLGGENDRAGANALIHEMLHALGLTENPPSSVEITARVRERCGL